MDIDYFRLWYDKHRILISRINIKRSQVFQIIRERTILKSKRRQKRKTETESAILEKTIQWHTVMK